MTALETFCKQLKQGYTPKKYSYSKPVSAWSEPDRFNDAIIKAFVIILRTKGCSWSAESGCTMCGYFNDSALSMVSDKELIDQYQHAMKNYNQEPVVKIFTSGSFFDVDEISKQVRAHIFQDLSNKVEKIAVESRPEYVTPQVLDDTKELLHDALLEVGIGLETANDKIRKEAVNKGFLFEDYKKASMHLKTYNHLIKTYVLVKPPFLTEPEAIDDAVNTIDAIKDITDTVSINPTNIQKNTLVEYLWRRKQYRPPWLWSVIDIIQKASALSSKRLQCDISGGGKFRGPHNCFKCDTSVLKAINAFSLHQDPLIFNKITCDCKKNWQDQLDLEPLSFGSLIDMPTG
jgi:archaeosine synthase beta-subunit